MVQTQISDIAILVKSGGKLPVSGPFLHHCTKHCSDVLVANMLGTTNVSRAIKELFNVAWKRRWNLLNNGIQCSFSYQQLRGRCRQTTKHRPPLLFLKHHNTILKSQQVENHFPRLLLPISFLRAMIVKNGLVDGHVVTLSNRRLLWSRRPPVYTMCKTFVCHWRGQEVRPYVYLHD